MTWLCSTSFLIRVAPSTSIGALAGGDAGQHVNAICAQGGKQVELNLRDARGLHDQVDLASTCRSGL